MKTPVVSLSSVGQQYKNFTVTNVVDIEEIKSTLVELVHDHTGAKVMHIAHDDPENVFCVSFRTTPITSDGVAHILEHTVLCGSEKFPVKDPFFSMNRRSLNTFMNAMTGSDFTCYPAASQVKKDYYNLLEVYLDAVFHPKIHELSFLQEGHRLEFEDGNDATTPLRYKGVVFNEMKGAYSSPDARLWKAVREAMFPDVTYGCDSGGDPKEIPSLTYEGLLSFHERHYHPSRALFFFYGDMPLEGHLDFIEEHALAGVEKKKDLPALPRQPRFTQPQYHSLSYPVEQERDVVGQTYISFSWLTTHILEQRDLLALAALDLVLTGNDASPLKHDLLKTGLCKQVEAFLEEDINEVPYVVILKGCDAEDASKLEMAMRETLQRIAGEGVDMQRFEAALHQLELQRTEITGSSYPFGLSLFMRAALLRQHGGSAEDGLKIHSLFDTVRESCEDPGYLPELIKKYFLNNPHFICTVMVPDKDLERQEKESEETGLAVIEASLSEENKQRLVTLAQHLEALQEKEEGDALETLPKVTLADVPAEAKKYPTHEEEYGPVKMLYHDTFTNGMIYADLIFNIPELKYEELAYTRLFTSMMTQIGSGGRDYKETLHYMEEHTGGVGASLSLPAHVHDTAALSPYLGLRGKALGRNVDKLFPFMYDMIHSLDVTDVPRLREIVQKHFTGLESSVNSYALRYATTLAAAPFSPCARVSNHWSGLEYYHAMRDLAQNFDDRVDGMVSLFESFKERLLGVEGAHFVVTCDEDLWRRCRDEDFFGISSLAQRPIKPWSYQGYDFPVEGAHARTIASAVSFTSYAIPGLHYTHEDTPALNVASELFENKTLHKRIREQGGAYGSGAVNNPMRGVFYFYTYRDPHIVTSLGAMREAVEEIANGNFDARELEEAKLGIVQGLDSPISPGSRGIVAYSWQREGKTWEMRQASREKTLSLTREDIQKAVKKHLLERFDEGVTVSFADKTFLEQENAVLKQKGVKPLEIKTL
jgi:presequence protease